MATYASKGSGNSLKTGNLKGKLERNSRRLLQGVCMYVCMHMRVCIYVCDSMYICIWEYVFMYMRVCFYVYENMFLCIWEYVYMYISVSMQNLGTLEVIAVRYRCKAKLFYMDASTDGK